MPPLFQLCNLNNKAVVYHVIGRRIDVFNTPDIMPMRKSMGCVISQNPSVIPLKQMMIDKCQIVAKNRPGFVRPSLNPDHPFPTGTADDGSLIGCLSQPVALSDSRVHAENIAQVRLFSSCLQEIFSPYSDAENPCPEEKRSPRRMSVLLSIPSEKNYSVQRRRARVALMPPKPKLLERAMSKQWETALLGT